MRAICWRPRTSNSSAALIAPSSWAASADSRARSATIDAASAGAPFSGALPSLSYCERTSSRRGRRLSISFCDSVSSVSTSMRCAARPSSRWRTRSTAFSILSIASPSRATVSFVSAGNATSGGGGGGGSGACGGAATVAGGWGAGCCATVLAAANTISSHAATARIAIRRNTAIFRAIQIESAARLARAGPGSAPENLERQALISRQRLVRACAPAWNTSARALPQLPPFAAVPDRCWSRSPRRRGRPS